MLILTTAILVAIAGLILLWANPGRAVNQTVFSSSLHLFGWLLCNYFALPNVSAAGSEQAFFWYLTGFAVGGALPLHFLIVKDAVTTGLAGTISQWVRRHWPALAVTLFLVVVPFTQSFVPLDSTAEEPKRGLGYWSYLVVAVTFYLTLIVFSFRDLRRLQGAQRLELQVWLGGGCSMVVVVIALGLLWQITGIRDFRQVQPIVILLFYAGTAYAITASRLFDARQLLKVVTEKGILIGTAAVAAYVVYSALGNLNIPAYLAFVITVALTLWFAAAISRWLDRKFQFFPAETSAREAIFAAARSQTNVEALERAFVGVLKGWGSTEQAMVISGPTQASGHDINGADPAENSVARHMKELKWATPESLAREKPTPERDAVKEFLRQRRLGVLVYGEGPSLNVLVGVGTPASRRPYTFPQVMQLTQMTTIIENSLERTHYLVKAQHAEQLATVGLLGASLAHEIRNPLVSIKTFVQLLPKHHQDAAFRDKFFRLISDEVGRIDRLTEQLLDMATPRVYTSAPLHLHPLLKSSLDLVTAKADDRRIKLISDFEAAPDVALTDGTATKQVLLNLCFNAIHAVENRDGDRWIKIATRNVGEVIEVAISDNGPGISPDVLPKLFQPFQTTKSTGFGLGLAICSDILSGLKATIAADPPRPGTGATFRVRFPCPPLSS